MSSLTQTLKIFFPNSPDPPAKEVLEISNALDAAILMHVATAYVPAAFGTTFQSGLSSPAPFMISLSTYLTSVMTPVLAAALTAESVPGSNHTLAWGTVQPSFDVVSTIIPPFMAGVDGFKLWQAIVMTIRTGLIPTFPPPSSSPDSGTIGGDGVITVEAAL